MTDVLYIYEAVDVTNEDEHASLGVFSSEDRALNFLNCEVPFDEGVHDIYDGCTIVEVRKRAINDYSGAGVVTHRVEWEAWFDEDIEETRWERSMRAL